MVLKPKMGRKSQEIIQKARKRDGNGCVQEFSYGLLEVRAKIDTRTGLWPSMWAVGDFKDAPRKSRGLSRWRFRCFAAFELHLPSAFPPFGASSRPRGARFSGARSSFRLDCQVPWPKNGEINIIDAFQGMLKASVIHAGESGLASSAVFHAAARKLTPDARL